MPRSEIHLGAARDRTLHLRNESRIHGLDLLAGPKAIPSITLAVG
jgi:hypothetical protein